MLFILAQIQFFMKGLNILWLIVISFEKKIISRDIKTKFVNSNNQLANIFTKPLRGYMIDYICNKLGTYDLYAPSWRGVMEEAQAQAHMQAHQRVDLGQP